MTAIAPLTFADLHADAGKPCCLCLAALDPAEADGSGLAHAGCSADAMHAYENDDERYGSWFHADEDWLEYEREVAKFEAADPAFQHGPDAPF